MLVFFDFDLRLRIIDHQVYGVTRDARWLLYTYLLLGGPLDLDRLGSKVIGYAHQRLNLAYGFVILLLLLDELFHVIWNHSASCDAILNRAKHLLYVHIDCFFLILDNFFGLLLFLLLLLLIGQQLCLSRSWFDKLDNWRCTYW